MTDDSLQGETATRLLGGRIYALHLARGELHVGNAMAAAIWARLDAGWTRDEVLNEMTERYSDTVGVETDLDTMIASARALGMLA